MHEKMYNGIEPSYLNVRISPTMPQLCSPEQSFYGSDLHQSPSRDVGGSDSYGSPVSSLGSPDIKSVSNFEDSFKNEPTADKKSIKILQRPSTARSTESRLHLDAESSFAGQLARRGHRKKTLSLNPEEREALESLIEDVIIVGLDDAVIDSDESFDENIEDDKIEEDSSSDKHTQKSFSDGKGFSDKFFFSRECQQNVKIKNNISLNSGRPYGSNGIFSKDTAPRRHGKELFKTNSSLNKNGNIKDFPRNKDLNFCNGGKPPKDTPKKSFMENQLDESGDKERHSVTGMLGVNIYPAQLKVAIKHMDSLPPRFLRRLQSGQNRIGGSEPALQSLSELNMNSSRDSFPRSGGLNTSDSSSSPGEKDRSRSKQNQLEETKKTIRNLLSDLDQYTDEGLINPVSSDGLGCLGPFMPIPSLPPSSQQMEVQKISYELKPPIGGAVFRMPHARYSSESRLDLPHPGQDVYVHGGHFPSAAGFQPDAMHSRDFASLDVAHVSSAGYPGFSGFKPVSEYGAYNCSYENPYIQQQHLLLKKTSLKADAPVFVSNHFQRKHQEMGPQKSPNGSQMTTAPNQSMESGGIAFLPGVLNAEMVQHANLAKKQQQKMANGNFKPPTTSFGNGGPPHPYKMMHGQVYAPIQPSSQNVSGAPIQNGMLQQQQGSMMRMVNYGASQPRPSPQMHHFPSYSQPSHSSVYGRPSDFSHPTSVYRTWNCPPSNGDLQSGDSQWFPPMMPPYLPHAHIEGTPSNFIVGDHQGMVPMEMMNAPEWKAGVSFGPSEVQECYSTDSGRQRVMQLLNEGHMVLVIFTGCSDGDELSKLQINISGIVVLSVSGARNAGLSPAKLKEQQEWNYRQAAEAMESRKSLVIIDHSYGHISELHEYIYLAQMNCFEIVIINNSYVPVQQQGMENATSPNNASLFVTGGNGNSDYKQGIPGVGYPSPGGGGKPEGSFDFQSNNA